MLNYDVYALPIIVELFEIVQLICLTTLFEIGATMNIFDGCIGLGLVSIGGGSGGGTYGGIFSITDGESCWAIGVLLLIIGLGLVSIGGGSGGGT